MDVNVIKSAFVVGEGQRWEVPAPVTSKCLEVLLGCYHVFDRQYPSAYRNVMSFFDINLLELSTVSSHRQAAFQIVQIYAAV